MLGNSESKKNVRTLPAASYTWAVMGVFLVFPVILALACPVGVEGLRNLYPK